VFFSQIRSQFPNPKLRLSIPGKESCAFTVPFVDYALEEALKSSTSKTE
jgi:hypothetical protein